MKNKYNIGDELYVIHNGVYQKYPVVAITLNPNNEINYQFKTNDETGRKISRNEQDIIKNIKEVYEEELKQLKIKFNIKD